MDDSTRPSPSSKNRGRAARRHQRGRMIAWARRSLLFMSMSRSEREAFARKDHDHLASCSCWMCGNPRRFLGEPTLQEQREDTLRSLDAETDR